MFNYNQRRQKWREKKIKEQMLQIENSYKHGR